MTRSLSQHYVTTTHYGNTNWSKIITSPERAQLERVAGNLSIEGCIIQKVREIDPFYERLIIRNTRQHSVCLGVSWLLITLLRTLNNLRNREKTSGRLGLEKIPQSSAAGVPYPVQLRMPGVRIVNLVAGGMYVAQVA